jgi:hypothetical protein
MFCKIPSSFIRAQPITFGGDLPSIKIIKIFQPKIEGHGDSFTMKHVNRKKMLVYGKNILKLLGERDI